MKTCAECMLCLLNREVAASPPSASADEKALHLREVMLLLAQSDPSLCSAQLSARIAELYIRRFGAHERKNYAELKRIYNERMLALEPRLQSAIDHSPDPLACAMKMARVGNYIDFGAKHEVDDAIFYELLADAEHESLDEAEYRRFQEEMETAESAVYITDNAGEIVLDKLLLRLLTARYPHTAFTLLVRGAPTLNDATAEDAEIAGITAFMPVMGNGNALPGTVLGELSPEAAKLLQRADVVIAKGQANFETLSESGLNIYYLLLCKCDYFVRRFQVPRLTGMFVNEHRLPCAAE